MNYLAHLYLSGNETEVRIGNFIADGVKGKQINNYSQGVIKGIKLHRFIDSYTDSHEIVEQSKARLREKYRKYAGVITDIFYDHFLAVNWNKFSNIQLEIYTTEIYTLLNKNITIFPEKIRRMLPYMINSNWLLNYREIPGINKALTGMSRRTTFHSRMEEAVTDLIEDYQLFEEEFFSFFPQLITASKETSSAF